MTALDIHRYPISIDNIALENVHGQRIFDILLNYPLQRPGAVLRVETLLGQQVEGVVAHQKVKPLRGHRGKPRNKDLRPIWTALWDATAKTAWNRPFGTDQLGRDMLARMMAGGQVSVAVGITAMLLSLLLGTLIGVVAGYFRSLDGLLMRITDLFLALPLYPTAT